MHDSSLVQLIQSIEKGKLNELYKFLNSSPIKSTLTTLKLFKYIKRYYPEMTSPKLAKENAFYHLFPNEQFDYNKIRKQMHLLKTKVEDFVIHEQVSNNKAIQQRILINHYYSVEDYKKFSIRVKKRIKVLKSRKERDAPYYLEMLWLYEKLFYHPKNGSYKKSKSDSLTANLFDHLDLFFIISKLRFKTDFNIRRNVIEEDTSSYIPFEIMERYLDKAAAKNSLIWLYLKLYRFQQNASSPDVEDFEKCITIFQDHLSKMGKKECGFILNALINIAIAYQNDGHEPSLKLATRLFKIADTKELMLDEGQIQSYAFLNASIIGSGAYEFDWVENFISKYEPFLAEEKKEIVTKLSWGSWYYHKSKIEIEQKIKNNFLEESLEYIFNLSYSEFAFDVRIRSLQLRVFYDLHLPKGNNRVFKYSAKAFDKYLNDKLKQNQYVERAKKYKNFIKFIKKIAKEYRKKLEGKEDLEAIQQLEKVITKTKKVALKIWLLKEVRGLLRPLTTEV